MPRAKPASKAASSNTTLAKARAAAAKIIKKPQESYRVSLDPDQLTRPLPHLPTGSLIIDYLIGGEPNSFGVRPCPGLPRGRVSQVWGHESAGKTTLALTAAATTCAAGGTVLYVDWENDIVPDYAASLGVPITDQDAFELVQPETLEDGIKLAMIYAHAGVDLIIFDSVGAAVPARIADRSLDEVAEQSRVGELQAVWSQELPNLKKVIARTGAHVMGISQIRAKISTGPANRGPTTQPQGGNAWKFYSSVRLELRRIKNESNKRHNVLTHKTDDRVTGGIIQCQVVKCKLSKSQGRKEVFYINWGSGIDDMRSVVEIAVSHGVLKKGGSWYSIESSDGNIEKVQGTDKVMAFYNANPAEFQALYTAVIPYLGSADVKEEELDDLSEYNELFGEDADENKEGPDLSEEGEEGDDSEASE